jgi:xylitol oxidase
MHKREFFKASGALLAGGVLSHLIADEQAPSGGRTNWAGNYHYGTDHLHSPRSVAEVQRVVKSCDKLRALGRGHSFNRIADSRANQISLKDLSEMTIDPKAKTVTVGAGVSYGQVAPYLDRNGFALHNLASLPHISIAGACATATHGSGNTNGNLATAVSGLEMVTADGEVVRLTRERDGDRFHGAVVGLGAPGIVTKLTLDLHPTFEVRQVVYENLSLSQLKNHLDAIFGSGYSVSLFTDWQNHRATQVWIKSKVTPGSPFSIQPDFYGAKPATRRLHPLAGHSAENCTEQLGIPGPWYDRLPHFRMNFTPSAGHELQTEYFVPREKGYEAVLAVEKLRDQIRPHLMITELRTIDADDLWMSTCYKRQAMTLHFTWQPDWEGVQRVLPLIEEQLAPFDPRPHWAKVFTMKPTKIQGQYARLADFKALAKEYDPHGEFRNAFIQTNLYDS